MEKGEKRRGKGTKKKEAKGGGEGRRGEMTQTLYAKKKLL
jgi:hypothetical protein